MMRSSISLVHLCTNRKAVWALPHRLSGLKNKTTKGKCSTGTLGSNKEQRPKDERVSGYIWNQTNGTPGRGDGVRKTYKKTTDRIDYAG